LVENWVDERDPLSLCGKGIARDGVAIPFVVMTGLVPVIHEFARCRKVVDGRDSAFGRPGHDEKEWC